MYGVTRFDVEGGDLSGEPFDQNLHAGSEVNGKYSQGGTCDFTLRLGVQLGRRLCRPRFSTFSFIWAKDSFRSTKSSRQKQQWTHESHEVCNKRRCIANNDDEATIIQWLVGRKDDDEARQRTKPQPARVQARREMGDGRRAYCPPRRRSTKWRVLSF